MSPDSYISLRTLLRRVSSASAGSPNNVFVVSSFPRDQPTTLDANFHTSQKGSDKKAGRVAANATTQVATRKKILAYRTQDTSSRSLATAEESREMNVSSAKELERERNEGAR